MDPFIDQLADLCRVAPTRSKWVFVPTHAIGRTLGDRLALEGTDWANVKFVTLLDIALRMGAPFLTERGIDPSEEELGPALMMRLLLALPLDGGYFRPLAGHPTLAQALWTTVRELRMADLAPDALTPTAFVSSAKQAELVALLHAYERFLSDHRRADMATVYQEAVRHADWCPVQPQDCWTELPDANWTPLQRRLLDSLPGERVQPRGFELAGIDVPRRLTPWPTTRVRPDVVTSPLAFLMTPSSSPSSTTRIALFHAGSREAELEEVFRRVRALGAPLDQVEIACASDAHMRLVWEKALRHDWPVTLGTGIPATVTGPGRALIGLCDWIETDFAAGHLRRLLQSGDLRVEEQAGFTAGQAARALTRADAGWGRATYAVAFARLATRDEARAAEAEASEEDRAEAMAQAEQAKHVGAWCAALVDAIPAPTPEGTVTLQTVVAAVVAFLDHRTARSSALDHRAGAALTTSLGNLRALGDFACALPDALRFVRERVQSLTVAPERPRPGHLYACRLSQSGYAGRAHLFIVGLEEGRVFAGSTEDPVLLDEERARISEHLTRSTDHIDEAVYGVLSRLAVSGAQATFSYACRDTREFRDTFASWLMLQAYRLQQGHAALSYQQMKQALGEPTSAVPADRDAGLSATAWWLRSVVDTGDAGAQAVEAAFPNIARGRLAEGQRNSATFTAFDGYVPAAGPALDPCAPGTVYAVTELEKAAECPFRFLLKRGLGLRPVAARARDRDVWLDPLTRGSALHDVYAVFLRRVRDEQRRPTLQDADWLVQYARDRLAQLHEEMPEPTPVIRARESTDFLDDVQLFVAAEVDDRSTMAVGLEVSFGRPLDGDAEPLARAAPVAISLGDGMTLSITGRIDRIDEVGAATFEVLDYKTGGYWRNDWTGVFARGRRLQHALYGLAARELLTARYTQPTVRGGIYYFSSHKGRGERVRIEAPALASVGAVLADLRAVITSGHFTRTTDEGDCRYCDYIAACGGSVNTQAATKLVDAKAAAFRRLATHA